MIQIPGLAPINSTREKKKYKKDKWLYDRYMEKEKVEETYHGVGPLIENLENAAKKFDYKRLINKGAFGAVDHVQCRTTKKDYALKTIDKTSVDDRLPESFLQEVEMLHKLKHQNVVKFIECFISKNEQNINYFQLLFELCQFDLQSLINTKTIPFPLMALKTMAQQLLKGLEHVHQMHIMHRDLKPANVLVSNYGTLKIADFGMACYYGDKCDMPLSHAVCTFGYRAPELFLGSTDYNFKVDIWSAGIIIAELFLRRYVIYGVTNERQMASIVKVCGSINRMTWPGCQNLPFWNIYMTEISFPRPKTLTSILKKYATRYGKAKLPAWSFKNVSEMKEFYDEHGVDLVEKLLKLNPLDRCGTEEALRHPWFKSDPFPRKNIAELKMVYLAHLNTGREEPLAKRTTH